MMSLKTGPSPKTWAESLILSESSPELELIGFELVCSALTKLLAVFNLRRYKSCWNTRCIMVDVSLSLALCSTNNLVFLGMLNLSKDWNVEDGKWIWEKYENYRKLLNLGVQDLTICFAVKPNFISPKMIFTYVSVNFSVLWIDDMLSHVLVSEIGMWIHHTKLCMLTAKMAIFMTKLRHCMPISLGTEKHTDTNVNTILSKMKFSFTAKKRENSLQAIQLWVEQQTLFWLYFESGAIWQTNCLVFLTSYENTFI